MDYKEAKEILKDFADEKIERDKLEVNVKGGYKIGAIYRHDLSDAIETILNRSDKLDKLIDILNNEVKNPYLQNKYDTVVQKMIRVEYARNLLKELED